MKFHGIDVQGYLKIKEYDSVPSYNSSTDERRLIYIKDAVSNSDSLMFGGGETGGWIDITTSSTISGYYTKPECDGKFVSSVDSHVRNIDDWLGYVIFDESILNHTWQPVGVTMARVAKDGSDNYDNTLGEDQAVRRDGAGDIYAHEGILTAVQAQYADLAEMYTCDKLPIGTIVGVGKGDKEVEQFNFEMNGVVGVVSEKPALLMNKSSAGLPIALTGKVKVRVVGSIEKGDAIVPDRINAGCVSKGSYGIDHIVGYALESSDNLDEKLIMCIVK